MNTYFAAQEGWIEGAYRMAGDPLQMKEEQAKYLLPSGIITSEKPSAAKSAPKPVKSEVSE